MILLFDNIKGILFHNIILKRLRQHNHTLGSHRVYRINTMGSQSVHSIL